MKLTLFASLYVKIRKDFKVVYTEEKKKDNTKMKLAAFQPAVILSALNLAVFFFPISLLAVKMAAVLVHNLTHLVSFSC